jgi:hypothetical protein
LLTPADASASKPARAATSGILLALLAVAGFLWALRNGPIEDDIMLLDFRLAHLDHWSALPNLLGQSYWGTLHEGGLYRPLTLVTVAFYKLAFANPLPAARVVSLALHIACVLLVWAAARFFLERRAAFLAAAIFAVHPIHAEAVITLYGQSDLWAAAFALAALVLHLHWSEQGRKWYYWLPVMLLYFVSLGFKESAVFLPFALGAARGFLQADTRGIRRWFGSREALVLAGLLPYLLIRFLVLHGALAPHGDAVIGPGASLLSRLTIVIVTLGTYFRLLVFPTGQTVYYGHLRDSLLAGGVTEAIYCVLALITLAALGSKSHPWARAGIVLLAVFLLPVGGLIPIGVLVAERCLYLPSAAFAILAAGALSLSPLLNRTTWRAVLVGAIAAAGIFTSCVICFRWATMEKVWAATLEDHPRSPRAGAMVVLLQHNQPDRTFSADELHACEESLNRVEALNPNLRELWLARALLASRRGNEPLARECLRRADSIGPGIPIWMRPGSTLP